MNAPTATRALVPIERVHPHPDNIRDELRDIDEMVELIRATGILQDLLVTPDPAGRLILLDGHRRHEAARRLGMPAVPVVAKRVRDAADHIVVMLTTGHHQQLTPLEEARGFHLLKDRGVSFIDIGRRTGRSAGYVRDRLALLRLPEEAQDLLRAGRLTTTAAVDLARQTTTTGAGTVAAKPAARPHWFTSTHPLAPEVRALCEHRDTRRIVGGVGCGQCWEAAIVHHARQEPTA